MQGVEGASFQQEGSQYLDVLHQAASKECERYEGSELISETKNM